MAANGKEAVTLEQLKMYGDSFAPPLSEHISW